MDAINEIKLRTLLKRNLSEKELITKIIRDLMDPQLAWDEKRPYWSFLFLSGRHSILVQVLKETINAKQQIPFELLIFLGTATGRKPKSIVIEALVRGLKKQNSKESVFAVHGWDNFDSRLALIRDEVLTGKLEEQKRMRENMLEKFWFLRNQRMLDQAGRQLRRMLEIYPDDPEIATIKADFDEQWAREVLANHQTTQQLERTRTQPSAGDQEMLKSFLAAAEEICVDRRALAADMAIGFLFMDEYTLALEILAWAPPSLSVDWLKAELLVMSRRFIEALEHLNFLEMKYVDDPETTFAATYLRAQALFEVGQQSSALEIMQSILRVRPSYRSAHALVLQWTEGANW